jgi:hypothetical protein
MTYNELIFLPHLSGFGHQARFTFENGYEISVVCGGFFYCTPKEDLMFADEYDTYEVAVFSPDGMFVTDEFINCDGNDVAGYLNKDDISDLMTNVDNNNKRKNKIVLQ